MFLNRGRRGRERYLHVRVGLFFVAAAFLGAGMLLDERWPAIAAVAIAVVALVMRHFTSEKVEAVDDEEYEDSGASEGETEGEREERRREG